MARPSHPRFWQAFYAGFISLAFAFTIDLLIRPLNADAQTFEWVRTAGHGIALDSAGNLVLAYSISGDNKTNFGALFLENVAPDGTLLWRRQVESPVAGKVVRSFGSLSLDPQDRIYLTAGTLNTNNGNSQSIFLKLSPDGSLLSFDDGRAFGKFFVTSTGVYEVQANSIDKSATPTSPAFRVTTLATIRDVAISEAGEVYVTGSIRGPVSVGGIRVDASNYPDVFVGKLSPKGNWVWAQAIPGSYIFGYDEGYRIVRDASGDLFVTGQFGLANGGSPAAAFLLKMSPDGTTIWRREFPGEFYNESEDVLITETGDLFLAGEFGGRTDFGTITLTARGYSDLFLAKLDPVGSVVWIQTAGTPENDLGRRLIGGTDGLYLVGQSQTGLSIGSHYVTRPADLGPNSFLVFVAKRLYNAPPSIFGTPVTNYVRSAGSAFSFDAAPFIDASFPMIFSWSRDGVQVAGQTNSTLSIRPLKNSDAGAYRLLIANAEGTNDGLVINIGVPPVITGQPVNQTVIAGRDVTFQVTAEGAEVYQWRLNGAPVPGGTGALLELKNVSVAAAGTYSVAISNAWGSAFSFGARLIVLLPPTFLMQPSNQVVTAGQSATFTVAVDGAASFQWRFGNLPLDGANSATLVLNNVAPEQSGTYDVVVSNAAGSVTSAPATLTVNLPPAITSQPRNLAVNVGASATFSVMATNASAYQWYHNGATIPGAMSSVFTILSVATEDAGDYTVVVSGQGISVASEAARLFIQSPARVWVETIAGNGAAGHLDSENALQARLNRPDGPSLAPDGTIFFAETGNNVVRFLAPGGNVGTLAGAGTVGYLNGPGASALFSFPNGTCVLRNGDLLVTDAENDVLRRIAPVGLTPVTTFAGDGARGLIDGPAANARFAFPNDAVESADGTIYVSEFENNVIRRITPGGAVALLAGNGVAGGMDGQGNAARLDHPGGLTLAPDGNLYVTEFYGQRIRRITPAGAVTTLAGTGVAGFQDGPPGEARFNAPNGIVSDLQGNLYVTESANHAIRVIRPGGWVETVAGSGTADFADGDEAQARFNSPGGIAIASDGSLIIADTGNHRLRRINLHPETPPADTVALLAEIVPSLIVFGQKGQTYRIDCSDRVGHTNWVPLTNITLAAPAQKWIDPRPAAAATRIYRAVRMAPQ